MYLCCLVDDMRARQTQITTLRRLSLLQFQPFALHSSHAWQSKQKHTHSRSLTVRKSQNNREANQHIHIHIHTTDIRVGHEQKDISKPFRARATLVTTTLTSDGASIHQINTNHTEKENTQQWRVDSSRYSDRGILS